MWVIMLQNMILCQYWGRVLMWEMVSGVIEGGFNDTIGTKDGGRHGVGCGSALGSLQSRSG